MFSSREDICFDGCARAFGVLKSPAISESRVVLSLLGSEMIDRGCGLRLNLAIPTSQFATARHVLVVKFAQFHFCDETGKRVRPRSHQPGLDNTRRPRE